ncbi:hypothetical protein [Pseudomonas putida]|uniref:hypothetical protein n=1 Tax=Pseudomonas putida TaxID=303 RepID=UPI0030825F05
MASSARNAFSALIFAAPESQYETVAWDTPSALAVDAWVPKWFISLLIEGAIEGASDKSIYMLHRSKLLCKHISTLLGSVDEPI